MAQIIPGNIFPVLGKLDGKPAPGTCLVANADPIDKRERPKSENL
jgi:hypothetical protein